MCECNCWSRKEGGKMTGMGADFRIPSIITKKYDMGDEIARYNVFLCWNGIIYEIKFALHTEASMVLCTNAHV